jgi:calcineurin-like phosphoesterase family protein
MIHTWFTADFHLGHQNIIRYCNRPFHSTGEMDEAILANLNSLVRQDDVLYFLGDFCMGGPEQARRYRDRIVCRHIHVVELKSFARSGIVASVHNPDQVPNQPSPLEACGGGFAG